LYAYVVGAVCGTIANMDEAKAKFNQYSDSLTIFCQDQGLPKELATKLREFFRQSRAVQARKYHRELLSVMSPGLVAEVAVRISGPLIAKIPFFNPADAPREERYSFITAVTLKMQPFMFAAQEKIIQPGMRMMGMYVVKSGIAFGGPGYFFPFKYLMSE
jgi:hypothetical protein